MNIMKSVIILIAVLTLSACATIPKQPLVYNQGAVIESLSSEISLSLQTSEHSMSGNGFMVYRRPDQIHLIVLTPFGTTVFEIFAIGDQITLVYPSQGVAFSGHFNQLPQKGDLQGWSSLRWIMDAEPINPSKPDGTYEKLNNRGGKEIITIENGLITMKTNFDSERISYENYTVVNGVPIASVINIQNKQDDHITLKLQDPEINGPLSKTAFTPNLEGLKILPLSSLEVQ